MQIRYAGFTEKGLVRKINQDAILMYSKKEISVFCVADGMGGHFGGEIASKCIIDNLKAWCEDFDSEKYRGDFYLVTQSLSKCLEKTNQLIFENYNQNQVCGSTFVLLYIYKGYYGCMSLGDSRIYQKSRFRFYQITSDDVWENEKSNITGMTKKEIVKHSKHGKLTHAIGIYPKTTVHLKTTELKGITIFLLCSDGIYRTCSEKKMHLACIKMKQFKADEGIKQLKREAFLKGAPDNMSAIIVSIK